MNLIFYIESNNHYLIYNKIINYNIIIYLIMVISKLYLYNYIKYFNFIVIYYKLN